MTTISAKIILDSVSPEGIRLTTMQLRYPRFIHSEFMTHRVFSRNARSSRAVPVPKLIQECLEDPVVPLHWGAAQKGMQAFEECNNLVSFRNDKVDRERAWLRARDTVVNAAEQFHRAGYAKQVVNRLIEPFLHIDTLVTSTEWSNFLALRDHEMAEPHIRALAQKMKLAMDYSQPHYQEHGAWHLPYVSKAPDEDKIWSWSLEHDLDLHDFARKLSVARCAGISYVPFDGSKIDYDNELRRANDLIGSIPMHASPAEHQATPDRRADFGWHMEHLHGNLRGWIQYRKQLVGENQ